MIFLNYQGSNVFGWYDGDDSNKAESEEIINDHKEYNI